MEKSPISIGIENYKSIIDKSYYYVDKSLFIKELLDTGVLVNLFTRPRRFGKTLALSMLKTFFEQDTDIHGNVTDNKHYFDGMKIMDAGEQYTSHMGKYPVIFLSLKSAKQPDYEMAYRLLADEISEEFKRHRYVLEVDGILLEDEKKRYQGLMLGKAGREQYATALKFLSACLKKYHNRNVIILIDEYDVPLENAFFQGFYDEMIQFIRSLFESALKTNDNLEFAVITGCLRISKESIFTGMNNLKITSVIDQYCAKCFGFTQEEVEAMLEAYGLSEKKEEVREWYDGYLFGETEIYNPWSVINYVDAALKNKNALPRPYWSNTSANNIVRELVERADDTVKQEIELLIQGGSIEKPVHEDITYEDVYRTQDNLWNFLFFTGYLKKIGERLEEENIFLQLTIPNREIRYIFRNTIREWFEHKIKQIDRTPLYNALLDGDCEAVQLVLRRQLMEGISYHDNAESFYHGYVAGLVQGMPDYQLRSNREAGQGRPDIQLVPYDQRETVLILELKKADTYQQMEEKCKEALMQIEEKQYKVELELEGYHRFVQYGICFCKKNCLVRKRTDD